MGRDEDEEECQRSGRDHTEHLLQGESVFCNTRPEMFAEDPHEHCMKEEGKK